MEHSMLQGLRGMRIGLVLAFLAVLFGFGMGAAFGAAEDSLKGGLKSDAQAVLDSKYGGDAAKAKEVTDKAWSYYKRAHMHGGGIGAAAIAAILALAAVRGPSKMTMLAAFGMGFGALGYSIFWLWAGCRAPGMGSTSAAKESLEWLAVPTSGAVIVGWLLATILIAGALFRPAK